MDEDGMRNKRTSVDTEVARGDQKRTKNTREERRGGHLTWVVSNLAQGQVYEFRKESQ